MIDGELVARIMSKVAKTLLEEREYWRNQQPDSVYRSEFEKVLAQAVYDVLVQRGYLLDD